MVNCPRKYALVVRVSTDTIAFRDFKPFSAPETAVIQPPDNT